MTEKPQYTNLEAESYQRMFDAYWESLHGDLTITERPVCLMGFRAAVDLLHPELKRLQFELRETLGVCIKRDPVDIAKIEELQEKCSVLREEAEYMRGCRAGRNH